MSGRDRLLLLRNRRFGRYLLSDAISLFGDWFTYIGMTVAAGRSQASALAVILVLVAQTVPRALLSLVAGPLADRFNRRTLVWIAHGTRAVLVLAMAWASTRSHVLLHVLHMSRMAVGALADASFRAMLPELVEQDDIARAHRASSAMWSAVFSLGVFAGGLCVSQWGVTAAFVVDALSYVLAALALLGIPDTSFRARPDVNETRSLRPLRELLGRVQTWLGWVAAKVPITVLHGALFVAVTTHVRAPRGVSDAVMVGALHATRSVGSAVGPWSLLVTTSARLRLWMSFGSMVVSVALLQLGSGWIALLLGACFWGVGVNANWVATQTSLQQRMPREAMGRVMGADLAFGTLGQCVGGVVMGWSMTQSSLQTGWTLVLLIAGGLCAWIDRSL